MTRLWRWLIAGSVLMATAPARAGYDCGSIPELDLGLRKHIQTELKLKGFYRGAVDGQIGKNSRTAIEDFRKANAIEGEEDDTASLCLSPGLSKALLNVDTEIELDEVQQLSLMRKLGIKPVEARWRSVVNPEN